MSLNKKWQFAPFHYDQEMETEQVGNYQQLCFFNLSTCKKREQ